VRRLAALAALLCSLLAASPAAASEWFSAQPVGALGVPSLLGEVGDVEFFAPNHGVLITAGNEAVPAGLYAFDGGGWYPYATVCGGHGGKIAWAGPDEFWTISDQQRGQAVTEAGSIERTYRISLCHFVDGRVVGSYARPLGAVNSYLPLNAAACDGPSDCWFAGARLPGTVNQGAFHLHWNGQALTETPSLTVPQPGLEDPGRAVTGLAFQVQSDAAAHLYEGVAVRSGDVAPAESAEPSLVHEVGGAAQPFRSLFPSEPLSFGEGSAAGLGPLLLTGAGEGLWAVAGSEQAKTAGLVMRIDPDGNLSRLEASGEAGVLGAENRIAAAAAEPGVDALWLGFAEAEDEAGSVARVARMDSSGLIEAPVELPAEGEGLSPKGPTSALACPAAEQCWLATRKGWLFHRGTALPIDHDPALHVLITSRPPDESIPFVSPASLPVDDSGAFPSAKEPSGEPEPLPRRRKRPPLVGKVKSHVVDGRVLVLDFLLRARARVRLVASSKGKVIAATPRRTFGKGRRSLRLRLDPAHWPTKLDLQAHRVGKSGRGR
jgi:hypothetical protein